MGIPSEPIVPATSITRDFSMQNMVWTESELFERDCRGMGPTFLIVPAWTVKIAMDWLKENQTRFAFRVGSTSSGHATVLADVWQFKNWGNYFSARDGLRRYIRRTVLAYSGGDR